MIRLTIFSALIAVAALFSRAATVDARAATGPSRYLYVWAGTGTDTAAGLDMMTVLNADPESKGYGSVLAAITVDSNGRMPHHTEFFAPANGALFANDYTGDKSFLIDFSRPTSPRFAGRVAHVPGGRRLHSFARLADGNVVATVQFGDSAIAGVPGGLAEFDARGRLLRTGWSRDSSFPGAHIRTYGLAVLENIDRIVTTSSPMERENTADVIQVWRLSDLRLLKTLAVPEVNGDGAQQHPFEVRALQDGTVMLNTYTCGFYRISGLATTPTIERVMVLPHNSGCSVPVLSGHFMVMPIAFAHRYSIIDLADPDHPKEVASLPTDSTFFPHWASADPGSDRLVFTSQGDRAAIVKIAHFDRRTGRLWWDTSFRDPGATSPGVSFDRPSWPNGVKGMAMPHGAVFVP